MILVITNWLDFVRNHRFLFLLMMLAQLVSVLCIYFVYGVFQNNLYILLEGEHDNYRLAASFSDETNLPVKELAQKMTEEWGLDIDFLYLTAQDAKGNEFQDRFEYADCQYRYSQSVEKNVLGDMEGRFPSADEYASGKKVVVINGEHKGEIGGQIRFAGETYTVIGINRANVSKEYEMPFTAFPASSHVNYLSVSLKNLPTRADYERFADELSGFGAAVEDFAVANHEDVKKQHSLLLISVLLAILSGGNLFLVYCYIFRQRKENLVIFCLHGCTEKKARRMFFVEILFNMAVSVALALLVFLLFLYPVLSTWYEYLYRIYGVREYVMLTGIFVIITLLFGWVIAHKMTRLSLSDFRRGE